MEQHKVSVIIPVYKTEPYLRKCVDSVVNQTYRNLEIILVDDGSPDGCGAICDEYASKDDRVKAIHQENGGASRARNAGLDVATGDYVGFVDSDDWIEPDMYELLLNNALAYQAEISMCGETMYEGETESNGSPTNGETVVLDRITALKLTADGGSMGMIWNKIFCRSVIEDVRFDPNYPCSEDLLFTYQAARKATRMVRSEKRAYNYVKRLGSLTMQPSGDGMFGIVDVMREIVREETVPELYPYCVRGLVRSAYIVLNGVVVDGKFPNRRDELVRDILQHRKDVLCGRLYSVNDKLKTALLSVSPKLFYAMLIKRKRKR